MNIFSLILGDPVDAAANAAWDLAFKDLKAARLRGDKAGEKAALARMRKAANKASATAQAAIANVTAVENTAKNIKNSFKIGGGVMLGVGVILLVVILKK